MSININPNAGAVSWDALLGKLGEVKRTEGADGAAGTANITITMNVDGVEKPVTIKLPDDLDLPGEVDQAAIDSLCSKLSADTGFNLSDKEIAQIHETLTSTLNEVLSSSQTLKSPSLKGALFDLYKLMALLIEVAQKQRDASREMRLSENMTIQKSILDQADTQRQAARIGMWAGFACCALQVGATALAVSKQTSAMKDQFKTESTSGIDSARQNLDMIKAANTAEDATGQFARVSEEIGMHPSTQENITVAEKVNAALTSPATQTQQVEMTNAKNSISATNGAITETKAILDAGNIENISEEDIGKLETQIGKLESFDLHEMDQVKTDLAKFKPLKQAYDQMSANLTEDERTFVAEKSGQYESLSQEEKTKFDTLMQKAGIDADAIKIKTESFTQKYAEVNANLENHMGEAVREMRASVGPKGDQTVKLQDASENYRSSLKLSMQPFEDSYETALKEYNDAVQTKQPQEVVDAAKTKLTQAGDELKYARAYTNMKLMGSGSTDAAAHLRDVQAAKSQYQLAISNRSTNVDYLKATYQFAKWQAMQGVIAATGSFAQGFIQNTTQLVQAKATQVGAEQKKQEEALDQTKDLFNQAEELVNNIVKLMQAVIQAEVQSMRDAIQA